MIRKILCTLGFHKTNYVDAGGCSYSIECKHCKKDLNDQLEKYDTAYSDYYVMNYKGTFKTSILKKTVSDKRILNAIKTAIEKLKKLKDKS